MEHGVFACILWRCARPELILLLCYTPRYIHLFNRSLFDRECRLRRLIEWYCSIADIISGKYGRFISYLENEFLHMTHNRSVMVVGGNLGRQQQSDSLIDAPAWRNITSACNLIKISLFIPFSHPKSLSTSVSLKIIPKLSSGERADIPRISMALRCSTTQLRCSRV